MEKQEERTGAVPLLRDCDEEGEPTLTKFILRLEDEMDQRLMIALGKRKGGGFGSARERRRSLPERSFRSDAEILKDEPNTHVVIRVGELKRADAETADEVPGEHAAWRRARIDGGRRHVLR